MAASSRDTASAEGASCHTLVELGASAFVWVARGAAFVARVLLEVLAEAVEQVAPKGTKLVASAAEELAVDGTVGSEPMQRCFRTDQLLES